MTQGSHYAGNVHTGSSVKDTADKRLETDDMEGQSE